MLRPNEIEEIVKLIYDGFDLELLSFELDIPFEDIQRCNERLIIRREAKDSIKNGTVQFAIAKLKHYITNNKYNIVERMMLTKLQAYAERTLIDETILRKLEEEKLALDFSRDIDEILEELDVQIPRRKTSNMRKKEKISLEEQETNITNEESTNEELVELESRDFEKIIKRYKKEIEKNPQNALNKRNLLAYTYLRANMVDDARNELLSLIEEYSNYTAYRQLVYLEQGENNLEDAKLWAYDALTKYPGSIQIREQIISIAKMQRDNEEVLKQLKEIISISPENKRGNKMLDTIKRENER